MTECEVNWICQEQFLNVIPVNSHSSVEEMAELLFVPFKKSSDVDIVKPLKNLIQSTYNSGENTEDYTDALNELSRLRTNAVWKVFEKTSLDTIYRYQYL